MAVAIFTGSFAWATPVFSSTPSAPSSIAMLTSLAVPTPASTITGTVSFSRMMRMALGFSTLIGIVNTFGSAVTAAYGVGHRIIHLVMVPAFGLTRAVATSVGQNLGAGNVDRAGQSVRKAVLLIGALILPMTTFTFMFGAQILRIFIDDPQVVDYGGDLFRINSFSVLAFGFYNVMLGAFRGSGHTVPVMVLNMFRLWVIRIPAAWLLGRHLELGPEGVWWAMFLSNIVTLVLAGIWLSRGSWKRAVIGEEPGAYQAPR